MKKKYLFNILLIFFCFVLFSCSSEPQPPEIRESEAYYRVEYVGKGEFIVGTGEYNILVKYPNASIFARFDTAVIEFDEADLIAEEGSRSEGDYRVTYQYVLNDPKLVRRGGPDEPTFA